ncbi:DUF4397 domain-containing protein [Flavitalea sp. BT771]|nr:DUF4397 domain-containing protein [Flavitalea sp. BT771]
MRASNLFSVLIVALVVGISSGCMKTGSGTNQNTNNVSFISLMHMAPYSSSTEVYFNGDKKTSAIAAGTFSTSYGQIPPGVYDIKFHVAGSDSVLSSLPATTYDSLGFYTLILYNTEGGTGLGSMKINDDFSSLSLSGANYRFFNFCPDAPAVDLYMNTTPVQQGRHVADNASSYYYNSFQAVTAGGYSLQAKKAGTDSVIASVTSVNLVAGAAYTIFLAGSTHSTSNPVTLNVLQAAY